MARAIARDPGFESGCVVPVKRVEVALPEALHRSEPLYANLTDDSVAKPWDLLLGACRADLGTDVPAWLAARDEIRRFHERGQSVKWWLRLLYRRPKEVESAQQALGR